MTVGDQRFRVKAQPGEADPAKADEQEDGHLRLALAVVAIITLPQALRPPNSATTMPPTIRLHARIRMCPRIQAHAVI